MLVLFMLIVSLKELVTYFDLTLYIRPTFSLKFRIHELPSDNKFTNLDKCMETHSE